jgi:DNA-binding LacI/PurR family transcriptional regulator
MPNTPVTLETIAKKAGVHKTTVSRALRNHPSIPEATRQKVQRMAEKLGYQANPLVSIYQTHVRSRQKQSYKATLGWINDHPDADYWSKTPWVRGLVDGARHRAEELGYGLDTIWIDGIDFKHPDKNIARCTRVLSARGIFGIVVPMTFSHVHALHRWPGIAVATVGLFHEMAKQSKMAPMAGDHLYHTVSHDYFANMRVACKHLRMLGYRRIGLVMSHHEDAVTDRQYHGSFLAQQAYWPRTDRVPILLQDAAHGPQLSEWVNKYRPDVVLCQRNETKPWLEQNGYRVPEDLGVAHLSLAPDVAGWSGVNPNLEDIGGAAVELVVQQLKMNERQPPRTCHELFVEGRWIDGRTTRLL